MTGRIGKIKYSVIYSAPEVRIGQYETGFMLNVKEKKCHLVFEIVREGI